VPILFFNNRYILDLSIQILTYVMLGWGLNIVVGLAGFAIAGLIILIARMTSRRAPSRSTDASGTGDINQVAAALGDLAARELTSQTQAHPYRAFGVALIAGLAVGISPELRKILRDLSKK